MISTYIDDKFKIFIYVSYSSHCPKKVDPKCCSEKLEMYTQKSLYDSFPEEQTFIEIYENYEK